MTAPSYDVVIPTIGRDSLGPLLASLAAGPGPLPAAVLVVNDRPDRPLTPTVPDGLAGRLRVLPGPGRGPAAARNAGWRSAGAEWVVFVDDDVRLGSAWRARLAEELGRADRAVAAVQGRLHVPLPDRLPTDWERQVASLARAQWITADIAYRRDVLREVGGFDERFPRAYREDAELAARVASRGYRMVCGDRAAVHPVRPASPWVSLGRQRGNADDALLRRLYGHHWQQRVGVPKGRRPWHIATTLAGLVALVAAAGRRRRLAVRAAAVWAGSTADFAARRIRPGPRTPGEIATMLLTSALIPPLATVHWIRGWVATRNLGRPVAGGDAP